MKNTSLFLAHLGLGFLHDKGFVPLVHLSLLQLGDFLHQGFGRKLLHGGRLEKTIDGVMVFPLVTYDPWFSP